MPSDPSIDAQYQRGILPVSDPTILTTQQLQREVAALKEIIFTRLDGMDKAISLFNENITRVPTDTDKQISHLKELHSERFASVGNQFGAIERQFRERDIRREQVLVESRLEIQRALEAAREVINEQNRSSALAISKSEVTTQKQIDQQGLMINSIAKATDDKIDDLKERLTRIEGKAEGGTETKTAGQAFGHYILAIIGTIIGVAGFGMAIFALLRKMGP